MKRIKLLVSKCLLGKRVRYDGNHKKDFIIKDILGKIADFISICPEVDSGLPIPREPLILVKDNATKILSKKEKKDYTPYLKDWITFKLSELKEQKIDGIILKSKSPSCGLKVDIFDPQGKIIEKGPGIWAEVCCKEFSHLPIIEEKSLYNFRIRENFLCSIVIKSEWKETFNLKDIHSFHNSHKIFLKSKSKSLFKKLERALVNLKENSCMNYENILSKILKKSITKKFFENLILEFKSYLPINSEELMRLYKNREITDVSVVEILRYWIKVYSIEELKNQFYLTPLPFEFDSKYINL